MWCVCHLIVQAKCDWITMMTSSVLHELSYAPTAARLLNGCLCLYKPANKGHSKTRKALLQRIVSDLNDMECRKPRQRVEITGDLSGELKVQVKANLADHPLVVGPRYDEKHFAIWLANNPGWYPSGIVVAFIGPQAWKCRHFRANKFRKTYEIKGRFGFASNNFRDDGKIVAKSTFKHISDSKFERVILKMDFLQRNLIFKASGLDIQSEDAYKMAAEGFTPPAFTEKTAPLIYSIEPLKLDLPEFTVRVECLNEHEHFLAELINEIGLAVKSTAICTGIRLTNYGPFSIKDTLLQKHWSLDNLIENIDHCNKLVEPYLHK